MPIYGLQDDPHITNIKSPIIFLTASHSVPTFVKEILGERVHEEETVVFEALYSGNPVPGILFYYKLV